MPTLRKKDHKYTNITLHYKEIKKKKKKTKLKASRRKEITKIGAEINRIETRKAIEMINDTELAAGECLRGAPTGFSKAAGEQLLLLPAIMSALRNGEPGNHSHMPAPARESGSTAGQGNNALPAQPCLFSKAEGCHLQPIYLQGRVRASTNTSISRKTFN